MTPDRTVKLRQMISDYEDACAKMKAMLDEEEGAPPLEHANPLFKGIVQSPPMPSDSVVPMMPRGPVPQPVLPVEPLPSIKGWEELLFRPAMASAMLYVIMPVVEQIVEELRTRGACTMAMKQLLDQLDVWEKLTVAQRVVLQDLFVWVNGQLEVERSAIPFNILSNMAAATAAYNASLG